MPFYLISAAYLQKNREATVKEVKEVVLRKGIAQGNELQVQIQRFTTTNLDTLMLCNDKLLKFQTSTEQFLKKIDKQYLDLEGVPSHNWVIRGADKELPLHKYASQFKWNEAKYPRNYPLPKLFELFELKMNGVDAELRSKMHAYNETKVQLNQSTQKQGTYNVKDLADVLIQPHVGKNDFLETRFIQTVIAVVPTLLIQQFLDQYQLFTRQVIPHSARRLRVPDKDGLSLWTVYIFKERLEEKEEEEEKRNKKNLTPAQQFIEKAREKLKVVVKEFAFESGISQNKRKKKEILETKIKGQTKALSEICVAYFSEIFEMYMHAKVLRLVIETKMRFGEDMTVMFYLEPCNGKEKIVQHLLVASFGEDDSEGLYGTKDEIDDGEDFFPFIYVPGNLF